jgi:hypothetical protein
MREVMETRIEEEDAVRMTEVGMERMRPVRESESERDDVAS